jgi:large subunit ribosomal protein L23
MGLFDRFNSTKGKDQTAGPKRGVVKATKVKKAEDQAFAAVPAAQDEAPKGKAKTAKTKTAAPKVSSSTAHFAHNILLRAVVTEKSTRGNAQSQYTFEVATDASKADVRRAVHHLYGVTPVAVNMLNVRGAAVRFGRTYGRTINRKKAVITLPSGKTIDVVSA